jgi:ABC-type sugar transport system permease subunit
VRKETFGWILVLPSFMYLMGVIVVPWIYSIYLSFTNLSYTSPGSVSFVWDTNYIKMFDDPKIYASIGKTARIMVPAIVLQMLFGLFIAWGLYTLGTSAKVLYFAQRIWSIDLFITELWAIKGSICMV